MRKFGLESIARACARHPWRTLGRHGSSFSSARPPPRCSSWAGRSATSRASPTTPSRRGPPQLINEAFPGDNHSQELVILRSADLTVDDQQFRQQVQAVERPGDGSRPGRGRERCRLHHQRLAGARLHRPACGAPALHHGAEAGSGAAVDDAEALAAAARAAAGSSGFEVLVTGEASINGDFGATAENDLRTGEIFGLGFALVILVLVFGAVVTAVVPLIMAVGSILLSMGITAIVGQVMDLSFFITNMITMIGLAMGIDYSLFVVSRYREERAAGRDKVDAIGRAGSTASRSVLFSAMAVILALGGLFLVPSTLFHSMAMGAIIAVFTSLLGGPHAAACAPRAPWATR